MKFDDLLYQLPEIGKQWHGETIVANSRRNVPHIKKTVRELKGKGKKRAIVISAGPSLYRNNILNRLSPLIATDARDAAIEKTFDGSVIAIDGSYIQCLKAGILPDYVVTLDPHPTRMVRWFGDPDFEKNSAHDDYFKRQDLDVSFRKDSVAGNMANMLLVDGNKVPLVICSTAPENVVERTKDFERYWFAPLVDNPEKEGLTRTMVEATGLPAMNTGGTVGTAAWIFSKTILNCEDIAVVGMDLGYYMDTPLEKTQSYHMLEGDPGMYRRFVTPYGEAYTDPTYYFYRDNFLDLLKASGSTITNCSEAGMLFGDGVQHKKLEEWLCQS